MDYKSVEEILSTGISNMTVIRNNSKNDDSTDSVTGVSWFTFNGSTVSTVYVSGNSWIGFGSSNEHLRVNRRDAAVWSIYREEGTLYNHYKFLKIRWSGYTTYGQTTDPYKLEYDVILWDTGDISLHIVTWPTSNNTGTYSLTASSTYAYSVSASSTDITFKKIDNGFEVQNNIISIAKPYNERYLVKDGSMIYTVENGTLSSLGVVEIDADLFTTSGVEDIPDIHLLDGLASPELLYWRDIDEAISGLEIQGIPPLPQTILYAEQTIPEGSGIKIMEAIASKDALFCVTTDGGETWKYHNRVNWAVSNSLEEGMIEMTLKQITAPIWAEIVDSNKYQIRCVLPSTTSRVEKFMVGYTD